jgi:hypothetical protein
MIFIAAEKDRSKSVTITSGRPYYFTALRKTPGSHTTQPFGYKRFQNHAFSINRPPKVTPLGVSLCEHLVQTPPPEGK